MKRARRGKGLSIAVVGAGRLASALLPALEEAGHHIEVVASRDVAKARRLARRLRQARATCDLLGAALAARVVLVAIRDQAILPFAEHLASQHRPGWRGWVFLHSAGALGSAALAPLARRGADVGVLHPLQVLGGIADRDSLRGSGARIEGTRGATRTARILAASLGLKPLRSAGATPPARAAYHAGASLASNDLVALIHLAVELLREAGVGERAALAAILALARGALVQLSIGGFDAALTGPVARADTGTLEQQRRRIARYGREAAEVHRLLSLRLCRLAEKLGRLDASQRRAVEAALRRPAGRRGKRTL